jgi:TRAP-type mannitol/chloroaromatic compound transport system permease large subunit
MGLLPVQFLQAVPSRVFGSVLSNELLLAIPFFTFMGAILEKCGLAEDMLDSMGQLFGPVRGGLGTRSSSSASSWARSPARWRRR